MKTSGPCSFATARYARAFHYLTSQRELANLHHMRLFIAAELPEPILDALCENSAALRACVHGRFVGSDLFHVTLAFLGNVEGHRVDALCEALDRACEGVHPFEAELGEFGSFGRPKTATLWQGFRTGASEFADLAERVRTELHGAGFEYDTKGFRPHVTLMRKADIAKGKLTMPQLACGTVSTITLFSSDLSGKRPVYTALHRVNLQ